MDGPILKVEHLSMKFGGLVAIGDLSFEARRGEITALIGPNGAGKTTVFNCITGFYKPTEGMITLTGSKGGTFLLERMPDHEITARAKVARTFQNIRLFSGMTLLENLLVAQHNKLMRASGFTVLGLLGLRSYQDASRASIELARHWLEKAKLVDRADDPAGDLPYGAQRRLEIARAMCTGPELLCLDEPAAGLNPRESAELNTLLNDIKDTTGTSILLIEHDMSVVMQISDHVVVLEYGRKISDGDPTHVKNDPRVIAAYLGVEDEEVVDVLTEVGDDTVLEGLEGHPDTLHGPQSSSSMLAGSVMDTIEHDDPGGERITVSPNASRGGRTKAGTEAPAAGRDDEAAARLGAAAALGAGSGAGGAAATGTSAGGRKTAKAAAAALGGSAGAGAGKGAAAAAPARKEAGAPAAAISGKLPAPRGGRPDDLLAIKGIGPVNQRKLNEHGIFHFDQIAAWTQDDIAAVEAYLAFDGRIAREDWIGQARRLAADAAASPEKPKRGGRT
jgi:branched-chain amino acid transport system ATP-binding protein